MEGGIAFLLLLIIAGVAAAVFVSMSGGMEALRHRRGNDLGPAAGDEDRPVHRVAEPTEEHAAGFGVGGEHDTPQAPRVPDEQR